MHGLIWALGTKLPYPAGLLFAGGIAALACSVWVSVMAAIRGESNGYELALGGILVAAFLGVLGLLLVGLGAPAFK